MKKSFLFLALSLLLFGCEKTPQPDPESKISFGVSEAYMITNESRAFVVVFDNSIIIMLVFIRRQLLPENTKF